MKTVFDENELKIYMAAPESSDLFSFDLRTSKVQTE